MNLVNDGDILVSDMYLPKEVIIDILKMCGLNKQIELFLTPLGKAIGYIWPIINEKYKINYHLGDNMHSDINMAKNNGINGIHTSAYLFSSFENLIVDNNKLLRFFRIFKLMNPYSENTIEHNLYKIQAEYNIPLLCFGIKNILKILKHENKDTILFITRDCCLLQKIFETFYPQYKSIRFSSSRIINTNYNNDYCEYVKSIYSNKCLIVDIFGRFSSGNTFFMKLFNELPRVYILCAHTTHDFPDNISYGTFGKYYIETFNLDYVGSLINIIPKENGHEFDEIRAPLEHPILFSEIFNNTINKFIKYGQENNFIDIINNNLFNDNSLLNKFYDIIIPFNDIPQAIEHNTLETLCNKYKSDKGSIYIYYEKIIDNICNRKKFNNIKLLEIGLNKDNTSDTPSLNVWNDYFCKNITIYGFDINSDFLKFNKDNINIIIGDQSNVIDLLQLKNNNYHIIIDDGYHASKHQQISFKTLWSNVLPGGCYIIENLHYQSENENGIKTKELLLNWKNKNFITSTFISQEEINYIIKDIDIIDFFDSNSKSFPLNLLKNAFVVIYKKL